MKVISNERAKEMCEAVLTQDQIERARFIAGDRPGQNMRNLSRLSEYGNSLMPHDIDRESYMRILRWLEKQYGSGSRDECTEYIIANASDDLKLEYQGKEPPNGPWASPYWIARIVVRRNFNKQEYDAVIEYCEAHNYDWGSA